jgi:hypothetical protein
MTAQGSHTAADAQKVWRYMSFPKFAWLLQKKQLWLARADLLGDPWEIRLRQSMTRKFENLQWNGLPVSINFGG